MLRTSASRLQELKGRTISRLPSRFASSSASSLQSYSRGGILGWLFGDKAKSLLPLDFPLSGVELPPVLPDYVEPGKTEVTALKNGFKIASETSMYPTASIGLFVDCGSTYESPSSLGVTHLLKRMAFKSTRNRSHFRIVREVEAIGGYVSATGTRDMMGYSFNALKTYVPEMVELLIDCVRNPVFLDWEVTEQLQKVKADFSEASNNPQSLLMEAIHTAGFVGPLANPLIVPKSAIDRLNSTILEEFVSENYTAPRMVLAAYGVKHDELLSIAEPLLSDLPYVNKNKHPDSVYKGGDYRRQSDSGKIHFALAFELPSGCRLKDVMTLAVLQVLLGGGGSLTTNGPKKACSRINVRVLNEYPQIQLFTAFSNIYCGTGLFGIQVTTGSDFSSKAIDVAVKELTAIASPGAVDPVELACAKQTTKSAILMKLESRLIIAEDIGRQMLMYGERKPLEHFLEMIDSVSLQDISEMVQKLISSPLTMASYGDVTNLPTYDAVSSKLKLK